MANTFAGSGQYYTRSTSALWNPTDLTVSLWFRIPSGHSNSRFGRFAECGGNGIGDGWGIEIAEVAAEKIHCIVWNGTSASNVGTAFTFTEGTWHHLAFTSQTTGSQAHSMYIDGVKQGSTSSNTRAVSSEAFTVAGANNNPTGDILDGDLYGLTIYKDLLSDNEILMLANGVSGIKVRSDLMNGWWPLLDSGEDMSGGGNPMTKTGAPSISDNPPIGPMFGYDDYISYIVAAGGGSAGKSNPLFGPLGGPLTGPIG